MPCMPSHAPNMGMLEPRHLDSYKLNDPGGVGLLKPRVDGDKYTRPNRADVVPDFICSGEK